MYGIENTVDNIAITLYSDRRLLDLLWWPLCKVYVKSLCFTPETNIILFVNYTLIKKSFILQNRKKKLQENTCILQHTQSFQKCTTEALLPQALAKVSISGQFFQPYKTSR